MNWRIALGGLLAVVPLVVVLAVGFQKDPHAVPSVLVGRPAPAFHLVGLDGTPVDRASLAGRPAVLNFWATWCYPCQAEHALLQEAARYYAGRVTFLGVVYQDTADAVRQYLAEHPSAYPHLLDPNSEVAIDFGIAGVPESFILAGDGRIVHKQSGVLTAEVLRGQLDPLLAAAR